MSALLVDQKLEPGRLLVYTINKLIILKRYMRKKAFRIQDLIAYLRRTEKENQDQKQVEEQEMMDRIRPIVQSRLAHLISDRV